VILNHFCLNSAISIFIRVLKQHVLKEKMWVKLQIHTFLTSELAGVDWSRAAVVFTTEERILGTHCNRKLHRHWDGE